MSELLGDVDPLIAEKIAGTGASPGEIAEALRAVEDERGFGEESHAPSSARVAEIRAMFYDLFDDEEDDY